MDHPPLCIGTRTYWVSDEPHLVLLASEDRAKHLYILGKTGLGKSTLLRNLILQDLYAGRGVGLLDPHGDLAREVLDVVPRARTNEVLYFNPADLARPVGLDLLPQVSPERRPSWARAYSPPSTAFGATPGDRASNTSWVTLSPHFSITAG